MSKPAWSREKPTQVGHYWYSNEPSDGVCMLWVWQSRIAPDRWFVDQIGVSVSEPLTELDGWWIGPLDEPEEPKRLEPRS